MSDPFQLLREHVRGQVDLLEPETGTDELIAHITLEHHRGSASRPDVRRRPRRWSSVALGVAVSLGIATGAAVTAAVLERERVKLPEAGVMCRPSATDQRQGIFTDAGDDPIAACRALWNSGQLPLMDEISDGTDPELVACTGDRGVVEVYPGRGPAVCTALGLAEADIEAMLADPRRELLARITAEIHEPCLSMDQAVQRADELLDELGFEGWSIVRRPGEGCGLVDIGTDDDHTLYVTPKPPQR